MDTNFMAIKYQKANDEKFQNIQLDNFGSTETKTRVYRAIVVRPESGHIKLSLFSLVQIIMGAGSDFLYLGFVGTEHLKTTLGLMSKLSMHMLDVQANSEMTIELTREEIEIMRKLLESRMKHCEHERDTRSDKFNPDTYISQKYLLLEIREWLMCQSMEVGEEILQESVHEN